MTTIGCVELAAPRPVAPLSTTTSVTRTPTFEWALAPNSDGARVEICADRACSTVETTFDATGTEGAAPTVLAPGVHFWRLFGRAGAGVGVAPSATWELVVGWGSAARSTTWGTMGDYNGDGHADLAVGASIAGRVYVFAGSTSGLPATPTWTIAGDAGSGLGSSLASAGDMNGDGFADLAVGLQFRSEVQIHYGGAMGLATIAGTTLASSGGQFGGILTAIGDVDSDGYGDLAIGDGFVVSVFRGGPGGPGPMPSWTLRGDVVGVSYGLGLTAGDLDADGHPDLVIVAQSETSCGRAFVHRGTGSGLSAVPDVSIACTATDGTFGWGTGGPGLSAAGDLDGDGYADLIIGNPSAEGGGRVDVFLGGVDGISAVPSQSLLAPTDTTYGFGGRIAHLGDVNADGYGDVFVSNESWPAADTSAYDGRGYLFYGGASGLQPAADVVFTNPDGGDASYGVATAGGDVDRDGIADLAVSSALSDLAGRVRLYRGASAGISTTETSRLESPDGPGGLLGLVLAL